MLDPQLILTASLQTRYKFAEYLIYRPYIYKALHTPELVTHDDLIGCDKALHVRLLPSLNQVMLALTRKAGMHVLAVATAALPGTETPAAASL